MRVLKVSLEGITTSFRHPHFMMGVQPSFPMPPPATIYGHICSALGEWVDPHGIAFAYHFTARGAVEDVEHIHVLSAAGGRLPDTQFPKVLDGAVNPFRREILFQPRMTLYLNRPEWAEAFHSPVYPVVLGRSQDLCWYSRIEVVELVEREHVYLEHTLLPYEMATQIRTGLVELMPRWLDYEHGRHPQFGRYLTLRRRVKSTGGDIVRFDTSQVVYWADLDAPRVGELPLGLIFHTFVDEGRGV